MAEATLAKTMQGIQLYTIMNSVNFKHTEEPQSGIGYHFQIDNSFQINLLNQLKLQNQFNQKH